MSRSYRSQKESVTAERRLSRAADGSPVLPRIIERTPAPGDSHPLPKRVLRRLLQDLPVEYLYGLARIELRARIPPAVGGPFGCYWVDERAIVLYSLPPTFYFFSLSPDLRRSLNIFHARVETKEKYIAVSWPDPALMTVWFYSYVFTYELGHHFIEQYKTKNSRIRSRKAEELLSDLHAERLTDRIFGAFRKRNGMS